jgi:hypothetical protein
MQKKWFYDLFVYVCVFVFILLVSVSFSCSDYRRVLLLNVGNRFSLGQRLSLSEGLVGLLTGATYQAAAAGTSATAVLTAATTGATVLANITAPALATGCQGARVGLVALRTAHARVVLFPGQLFSPCLSTCFAS